MFAVMMISFALSGLAAWSWSAGWFWWFMLIETAIAAGLYAVLRRGLANAKWRSME